MGVPSFQTGMNADAVVLGIPYDIATHPHRVGSRLGPDHVRFQSVQTRPYLSDAQQTAGHGLTVADAGNVIVTPGRSEEAFVSIQAAVEQILDASAVPVTLGGDGAVTLPQLRAVAAAHPGLVVVHLDAHTDCYPVDPDEPFTNATTFTHAASEGLIDVASSFHLGVRGTSSLGGVVDFARQVGYRVSSAQELLDLGMANVASEILRTVGSRPVYLCWDMDVFDPSVAPGVCTPEWGGLSAAQGIELMRSFAQLNLVAVDINTVSPPHDPTGSTGSLAARMLLEALHSLA
jgi:agmatinase